MEYTTSENKKQKSNVDSMRREFKGLLRIFCRPEDWGFNSQHCIAPETPLGVIHSTEPENSEIISQYSASF